MSHRATQETDGRISDDIESRLVWIQNVITLAYCDYKIYKVEKTRHCCRFHWMLESSKAFSFREPSPPDPRPDPAGGSAPDSRYRLAPARHDPCVPVPFSLRLEPWPYTNPCFTYFLTQINCGLVVCRSSSLMHPCCLLVHVKKINKDGGRAEDADVVIRTKILLRIDCFYASIEIGESKCCCVIK